MRIAIKLLGSKLEEIIGLMNFEALDHDWLRLINSENNEIIPLSPKAPDTRIF